MLHKVTGYIEKVVSPICRVLNEFTLVVLVLAMLLVVVNVIMRRLLHAAIGGSHDLTTLAFSMMVFLPLGWTALKDGHVDLNLLVNRFPRGLRRITEMIMMLLSSAALAVLTWRLYEQGVRLQDMDAVTPVLLIPMYPFTYLAVLGGGMVTLAFFIKFLYSIINIMEKK